MKEETLIHVKLEYSEAVESKRDVLFTEASLLRVLKAMKRYHPLRLEELKTKLKLQKKLKELNADLKQLSSLLPHIKIPEILMEGFGEAEENNPRTSNINLEGVEKSIKSIKKASQDSSLENQLSEIQERLRQLSV